ncbi:MAG: hypothetical protein JNK85_15605 [Verrucomicrobiales bacterium]|nr:hypothetical protein [Verrucomicrobiales bacterium]
MNASSRDDRNSNRDEDPETSTGFVPSIDYVIEKSVGIGDWIMDTLAGRGESGRESESE